MKNSVNYIQGRAKTIYHIESECFMKETYCKIQWCQFKFVQHCIHKLQAFSKHLYMYKHIQSSHNL